MKVPSFRLFRKKQGDTGSKLLLRYCIVKNRLKLFLTRNQIFSILIFLQFLIFCEWSNIFVSYFHRFCWLLINLPKIKCFDCDNKNIIGNLNITFTKINICISFHQLLINDILKFLNIFSFSEHYSYNYDFLKITTG